MKLQFATKKDHTRTFGQITSLKKFIHAEPQRGARSGAHHASVQSAAIDSAEPKIQKHLHLVLKSDN